MGLILLDSSGFERQIREAIKQKEEKMIQIFSDAGRLIVAAAKQNGNYRDVSGDLRNANGFLVMADNALKAEEFSSGAPGQKSRAKALQVAGNTKDNVVLVVVNGMDYAAKVESQGKDVLTSAEQIAKRIIPQMLQQLKQ